jgi:hypothetical protein
MSTASVASGMSDETVSGSVPLLRSILDPSADNLKYAPDTGNGTVNSIITSVDLSCSYSILANPASISADQTDVVPFSNGLVLNFPQYGVDAVYHMGIVPAGAFVRRLRTNVSGPGIEAGIRGLRLQNSYCGLNVYNGADPVQPAYCLRYNAELALPRTGTDNAISIEPQLSSQFNKVRAIAGKLTYHSSTISGANFNLSGTFSSGVLADTRDCCQVAGNGATRAFPVAALVTQSASRGDTLKNSQVIEGAFDLIGPDYPRRWTQPDTDVTDSLMGEFTTFAVPNWNALPFGPAGQANIALTNSHAIAQVWCSPWQTDFWVDDGSQTGPNAHLLPPLLYNRPQLTAIDEMGVFDIDVMFNVAIQANGAAFTDDLRVEITTNFTHVYATIDTAGAVQYFTNGQAEIYSVELRGNVGRASCNNGTFNTRNFKPLKYSARPKMMRSGFTNTPGGGKYLGTLVSITQMVTEAPAAATVASMEYQQPIIKIRARTIDLPGHLGPCHVLRYDDVAAGQQLQINGVCVAQGIAQGSLQPYIQQQTGIASLSESAINLMVDALFRNSKYIFRRMGTMVHYEKYIKPFCAKMDAGMVAAELASIGDAGERQVAMTAGAAAGLFGSLGSGLGSLLGPVGSIVGGGLGAVGDHFMGTSAGQFGQSAGGFAGDGQAAGQFGQSAGQFGQSAGQFGQYGMSAGQMGIAALRRGRYPN